MLPDFQAPKLRVYPRYTVVAEKLEAIATLGIANSRMNDFFGLWILSRYTEFDGDTLRRAIRETFVRRNSTFPTDAPFGLTDDFARDKHKQMQWQAFLGKNRLEALALEVIVAALRDFLLAPVAAANADIYFPQLWPAGAPGRPRRPEAVCRIRTESMRIMLSEVLISSHTKRGYFRGHFWRL